MQRTSALRWLPAIALLLAGCVYDPYTGTYQPCCGWYGYPYYGYYGYPYYRYPPPYYQYYGNQQQYYGNQSGAYTASSQAQPGPAAYPSSGDELGDRFAEANVTHDGRLTRAQAVAGMPLVAQNFDAIDVDQKGYVTLPEVRAFAARQPVAPVQ
jgi:hypothetical protein